MQETFVVNQKKYTVIRLLGHGKGGYSYLVERNGCQYVLKQIHHEPCDYYQFGNKIEAEINDYKKLSDIGIRIPRMIDVDVENERIIKEYICYLFNEVFPLINSSSNTFHIRIDC